MKKIILWFIVLCYPALKLSAQVWAAPGAVWNYTFKSFDINNVEGFTEVRYLGDTLIGGVVTNKLLYQRCAKHANPIYPSIQPEVYVFYTRLVNGVVMYQRSSSQFDTLVNFNAT